MKRENKKYIIALIALAAVILAILLGMSLGKRSNGSSGDTNATVSKNQEDSAKESTAGKETEIVQDTDADKNDRVDSGSGHDTEKRNDTKSDRNDRDSSGSGNTSNNGVTGQGENDGQENHEMTLEEEIEIEMEEGEAGGFM